MLPLEDGNEIDAMLATPSATANVAGFATQFRLRRICLSVRGDFAGVDHVELTDAFRGAFGRVLMDQASAEAKRGEPCPWHPACALDVLWRERPLTRGLSIPKPVSFAVDRASEGVQLELRVFGLACDWAVGLGEAAVRAMRRGIRTRSGFALPSEPSDVTQHDNPQIIQRASAQFVRIEFLSPLRWRSQTSEIFDPGVFISSLANRVSGLARWHGLYLEEDWKSLRAAGEHVDWDTKDLFYTSGARRSGRQMKTYIAEGWHGCFSGCGDLKILAPLLILGAHCGAGSNPSLGLGRYLLQSI